MTRGPGVAGGYRMAAELIEERSDPGDVAGLDHSQHPSVIDKVRQVLEVLGSHGGCMGPSALARSTHLPKSTVFRLCQELTEWGVVERVGTGFRLGWGVTTVGLATSAVERFREVGAPYAVELYSLTRMTTNLSLLVGTDAVLVDKVHGQRDTGGWIEVGLRAPAYSSSAGRAILAFSSPSVVSTVLEGPFIRTTPFSLVSPQLLLRELERIRESRLAWSQEEVRVGEAALASPVFGPSGHVVGALSVSAKTTEFASVDLGEIVKRQAEALSVAMQTP